MIPQTKNSVIVKWIKTEPYSIKEQIDKIKMVGYDAQDVWVEEIYDIQQRLHSRTYYTKQDNIKVLLQSDYFYYTDGEISHIVTITDEGDFVISDAEGKDILDIQYVCAEMLKMKKNKDKKEAV